MASLPDHLLPGAVGKEPISRDVLEQHQRRRVLAAATGVFARRGYQSTTVDQIVSAAKIGVGSFYGLFEGREDCFLRLYDLIVAEAEEAVGVAAAGEGRWEDRVVGALRALLELAARSPTGPGSRSSRRPPRARPPGALCGDGRPACGGPARGPLRGCARRGPAGRLRARGGRGSWPGPCTSGWRAASRWSSRSCCPKWRTSSSLRSPAPGCSRGDGLPGAPAPSPGRHGLPRDFVVQNQRDRLAAGIIAAVSEFGYHETTITQIAAAAGVSRRTFYSYFNSKEECFFATFDQIGADHLCDAAREAAAGRASGRLRSAAKIAAALEVFSTNPQLARFTLAAPPRAGGEVTAHYRRALDGALAELTEGLPGGAEAQGPSPAVQQSLIGGAVSLIVQKLEAGEGERIRDLLPDLVELFLAPFIGRAAAVRAADAGS